MLENDRIISRTAELFNRFEQASSQLARRQLGYQPITGVFIWGQKTNQEIAIDLSLMAITHGNEVAGLEVLVQTLEGWATNGPSFDDQRFSVGFVLGNLDAALANQRFLESDLNRSFDRSLAPSNKEQQRAKDLEPILRRTKLLLDLHQTIEPTKQPFFIFPYEAKALAWAQQLKPDLAIITHWGGGFSKDGRCTDEFVNRSGGVGLTLEMGQKGFGQASIDTGLSCVTSALTQLGSANYSLDAQPITAAQKNLDEKASSSTIYTWAATIPWPSEGLVELKEELTNFQEVKVDEVLGKVGSQEITVPTSGFLMFPKYVPAEIQQHNSQKVPAELCRILRTISPNELPS